MFYEQIPRRPPIHLRLLLPAPGAVAVIRSFGEPQVASPTNRAAEDRSMLWGIVDVKPAAAL
jgi:hypothetical protein